MTTMPLLRLGAGVAAALTSIGTAGLVTLAAGSASAATPTAATPTASAPLPPWFHDPVSASDRRTEIAVPSDPSRYDGGPLVQTKATFRTHNGSIAVPVKWAYGHSLVAPEALTLTNQSLFLYNSPTVSAVAAAELRKLSGSLGHVTAVRCEGHTDFGGTGLPQLRLSLARARSVCSLIKRDRPAISTWSVGYGLTDPVVVGARSVDRAQNRRVDIVVTGSDIKPSAPGLITVKPGDKSATLTFTASRFNGGSPITGYQVSTDGGRTWHTVVTATAPGRYRVTQRGLTNGTTYRVEVRAVNAAGDSLASNTLDVTPSAVPVAPVLSGTTGIYDEPLTGADLSFPTPNDGGSAITGYLISIDSGLYVPMAAFVAGSPNTDTEQVSYPGYGSSTHTFQIEAVNADGDSDASNLVTIMWGG